MSVKRNILIGAILVVVLAATILIVQSKVFQNTREQDNLFATTTENVATFEKDQVQQSVDMSTGVNEQGKETETPQQEIKKNTQSSVSSDEITDIFAADVISKLPNDTSNIPGERHIVSIRNDHIGPSKGGAKGNVVVNIGEGQKLPSQGDGSTKIIFFTKYDSEHEWYSVVKTGIYIIDIQSAADFSDDKILMGASHNVFIGKVVRQIGDKERGIGPETQFQVAVIDNIKGELNGTVTVDQQGGYRDGALYVVGEDAGTSYMLQPGSTYLFATRYNPTEDWYTLNSYPTASKLLSTNAAASDASLKTLSESDQRVQELKAAYPHEILIDADIAHNNARNSYESVQAAKSQ